MERLQLNIKQTKTNINLWVVEWKKTKISYVGNIINGKKLNPSRDALLSICLAIGTELEEAQYLLKYAGQAPLYVRRKRDVVIWFGFMKHMSLDEVDEKLIKRGYKPLLKGT